MGERGGRRKKVHRWKAGESPRGREEKGEGGRNFQQERPPLPSSSFLPVVQGGSSGCCPGKKQQQLEGEKGRFPFSPSAALTPPFGLGRGIQLRLETAVHVQHE